MGSSDFFFNIDAIKDDKFLKHKGVKILYIRFTQFKIAIQMTQKGWRGLVDF
jgi:hypothetical protein